MVLSSEATNSFLYTIHIHNNALSYCIVAATFQEQVCEARGCEVEWLAGKTIYSGQ